MSWTKINGKCPKCGKESVERNNSIVLTSYPPQHQYRCTECNSIWSATNDNNAVNLPQVDNSILNSPVGDIPYNWGWGQQGWICPKCGAVLAPWTMECPHCRPGLNKITTSPNTSPSFPDNYVTYVNTLPKTYSSDAITHSEPNPNITIQC